MVPDRGYALIMVLFFLVLLCLVTVSLSENVFLARKHSFLTFMEIKGTNAADSGIAYALEAVRQSSATTSPWWATVTAANAVWIPLETEAGLSVCFEAFPLGAPTANQLSVQSYGEVVRGPCGNYTANPEEILSARTVQSVFDLTPGQEKLVSWQEVLP